MNVSSATHAVLNSNAVQSIFAVGDKVIKHHFDGGLVPFGGKRIAGGWKC